MVSQRRDKRRPGGLDETTGKSIDNRSHIAELRSGVTTPCFCPALARWLMRNEHDAEDALQEASLRAFRDFTTFSGGDGRAWFLSIVRNTCRGWRARPFDAATDPFDEEQHSSLRCKSDPEALMHHHDAALLVTRAMSHVPDRVRDLLVLREVEGLSYRELADVMQLPMGTVMSRLSRARDAFRGAMTATLEQHGIPRQHIFEADATPRRRVSGGVVS